MAAGACLRGAVGLTSLPFRASRNQPRPGVQVGGSETEMKISDISLSLEPSGGWGAGSWVQAKAGGLQDLNWGRVLDRRPSPLVLCRGAPWLAGLGCEPHLLAALSDPQPSPRAGYVVSLPIPPWDRGAGSCLQAHLALTQALPTLLHVPQASLVPARALLRKPRTSCCRPSGSWPWTRFQFPGSVFRASSFSAPPGRVQHQQENSSHLPLVFHACSHVCGLLSLTATLRAVAIDMSKAHVVAKGSALPQCPCQDSPPGAGQAPCS